MRQIWRSPGVRAFLRELAPEEREAFHEHELVIYRHPEPDFQTRFPLSEGDTVYYVYYGDLYELIYRLDPPGAERRPSRRRLPVDLDDTLLIVSARLAEDELAA